MRERCLLVGAVKAALTLGMAVLILVAPRAWAAEPGNDAALALLDQGELAAAGGNFDKARQLWEKALQQRPGWQTAQRRLAELPARSRGHAAQVREIELRQQASLDFVEGVGLFNQGRYQEAARLFAGAAQVLPDHPYAGSYLALAREQAHLAGHGSLQVDSIPPAEIYLDGQAKGRTPLLLQEVPAGEHTLVAEAHGVRLQQRIVIRGRASHAAAFSFQEVEVR